MAVTPPEGPKKAMGGVSKKAGFVGIMGLALIIAVAFITPYIQQARQQAAAKSQAADQKKPDATAAQGLQGADSAYKPVLPDAFGGDGTPKQKLPAPLAGNQDQPAAAGDSEPGLRSRMAEKNSGGLAMEQPPVGAAPVDSGGAAGADRQDLRTVLQQMQSRGQKQAGQPGAVPSGAVAPAAPAAREVAYRQPSSASHDKAREFVPQSGGGLTRSSHQAWAPHAGQKSTNGCEDGFTVDTVTGACVRDEATPPPVPISGEGADAGRGAGRQQGPPPTPTPEELWEAKLEQVRQQAYLKALVAPTAMPLQPGGAGAAPAGGADGQIQIIEQQRKELEQERQAAEARVLAAQQALQQ